jgi:tRNA (guanine-N7-)-methyltransferase
LFDFSPAALSSPKASGSLQNQQILQEQSQVYLEIGYGSGEYLAKKAKLYPERSYIGCEVYENGIATMLSYIDKDSLKNVKLYTEDARELLQALPDNSIAGADILFADPWPKRKHNRRRIINQNTLDMLARLMPIGAKLFIATDHYDYLQWIMVQMMARDDFMWDGNWKVPPADYTMTRYEAKARESGNHAIAYLVFARASNAETILVKAE